MRHRKIKGRLSRRTGWRKATLKNLAKDLLKYQRIETTMAKAKALRSFVEPLITLAKNEPDSMNAKRLAFKKLASRDAVGILFGDMASLFKDVPGGYTRIMSLGKRKGDGAKTVIMELTKRSIPDEKLLGEGPVVEKKKKTKKEKTEDTVKEAETTDDKKGKEKTEKETQKKEDSEVSAVKKEQAKQEQKKIEKRGFFKRFQRKSI